MSKWEEAKKALNNDRYSTDDFKPNVDYITIEADLLDGLIQAADEEIAKLTDNCRYYAAEYVKQKEEIANYLDELILSNENYTKALEEITRLREFIFRAAQLIYGNPMTSRDEGETYIDAVKWLKEYKTLKENSDGR